MRDEEAAHERSVVALRDAVIAALGRDARTGSAAREEAVDEALLQLIARNAHRGDLNAVKRRWIAWARRRLIDEHRSAEVRHRAAVSVDDSANVLASATTGVDEISEQTRLRWRVREILGELHGDKRRWAELYYDEILSDDHEPGAHPRGLHVQLGWSQAKTNKIAQRARQDMERFIARRASGAVCVEHRELLDAFIASTSTHGEVAPAVVLERACWEQVLFHIAGCEDCWLVWVTRRRRIATPNAVLTLPLDALAGVWQGFGERLGALPARFGIGGGAAAGSGAATTLGTKTAVLCATAVCAAGATTAVDVSGVLPALPGEPEHSQRRSAPRESAVASTPPTAAARRVTTPPPPPPPPATRRRSSSTATTKGTTTAPALSTRRAASLPPAPPPEPPPPPAVVRATPGDLPAASVSRAPAPPPPPAVASSPRCVPGDLAC